MYERYCELRDSFGFRDTDVANRLGITKSTFSDWKHGKSAPNTEKLVKIAGLFGTTVEYLYTGMDRKGDEISAKDMAIVRKLNANREFRELVVMETKLSEKELLALTAIAEVIQIRK